MVKVTIFLQKVIQDSQDYGSDDEHMVSRVFFNLEIRDQIHTGLYADIKQSVGGSFESSPLEISKPVGYEGPFNYNAFRTIVENYYRSLVGASGSGIRIKGGTNVRMRNNVFNRPTIEQFSVE